MSTKGPSNHYGNARGGQQGKPTFHINYAWAKAFNKSTLNDHFKRHGSQTDSVSKQSYEAKAVKFANNVDKRNCLSFVDKKGSTYKYNKNTNELAIITKKGFVITYFKPTDGYNYYLQQKISKR